MEIMATITGITAHGTKKKYYDLNKQLRRSVFTLRNQFKKKQFSALCSVRVNRALVEANLHKLVVMAVVKAILLAEPVYGA